MSGIKGWRRWHLLLSRATCSKRGEKGFISHPSRQQALFKVISWGKCDKASFVQSLMIWLLVPHLNRSLQLNLSWKQQSARGYRKEAILTKIWDHFVHDNKRTPPRRLTVGLVCNGLSTYFFHCRSKSAALKQLQNVKGHICIVTF